MTQPAIRIQGLEVRRGGRLVLPGVDAVIPQGRVTGLLGPSGSGKTTLMRAIVGVQIVEPGTVEVLEGATAGDTDSRLAFDAAVVLGSVAVAPPAAATVSSRPAASLTSRPRATRTAAR